MTLDNRNSIYDIVNHEQENNLCLSKYEQTVFITYNYRYTS